MDGQARIAPDQFVGDPADGGVEGQTRLDGGHQQVQQVGEAVGIFPLPVLLAHGERLVGAEQGDEGQDGGQQDRGHAVAGLQGEGQQDDGAEGRRRQGRGSGAEIVDRRLASEEACADQAHSDVGDLGRVADGGLLAQTADAGGDLAQDAHLAPVRLDSGGGRVLETGFAQGAHAQLAHGQHAAAGHADAYQGQAEPEDEGLQVHGVRSACRPCGA